MTVTYETKPVSKWFGFDRGTPIDRYFIDKFLARHTNQIRGSVLEIGDDRYTRKFGTNVVTSDVMDIRETEKATFVGNLETGENIPTKKYDCIILTQVIQLIFDLPTAIRNIHNALRPEGVCLITVSGISPIWIDKHNSYQEHWRFTDVSLRRLLETVESSNLVAVEAFGNLAVAKAFLDGYALEDLQPEVLDLQDYQFQLVVAGSLTRSS